MPLKPNGRNHLFNAPVITPPGKPPTGAIEIPAIIKPKSYKAKPICASNHMPYANGMNAAVVAAAGPHTAMIASLKAEGRIVLPSQSVDPTNSSCCVEPPPMLPTNGMNVVGPTDIPKFLRAAAWPI